MSMETKLHFLNAQLFIVFPILYGPYNMGHMADAEGRSFDRSCILTVLFTKILLSRGNLPRKTLTGTIFDLY